MKVVLVGHNGAIGEQISSKLNLGYHKVVWSRNPDFNVTVPGHLEDLAEVHQDAQALVYNAGINILEWSSDIDPDDLILLYKVHVVGLVRALQTFRKLKNVIVIGSDAAERPMRTSLAYNASKAAQVAAVKVIARERASDTFQINVVAPGLIADTAMTGYVYRRTEELRPDLDLNAYMRAGIPQDRPGYAWEVAEVVSWLIEDAPLYLNGSVITLNGARS